MTNFLSGVINDRWQVKLPDFRVDFHAIRPLWEAGRMARCFEEIQPGMTVVDIGAEHGDFTALYRSWVGDTGTVIPVEPSHYWPCIRQTWEHNNFANPPAASFVGFISERTVLETPENDPDAGLILGAWPVAADPGVEIVPDFGFRHLAQDTQRTKEIRLDDLSVMCGLDFDVIVMDIEGAELRALRGLSGIIDQGKYPTVFVSVHEPTMLDWYNDTLNDIHVQMADYGYPDGEELPYHGEGETFWMWKK